MATTWEIPNNINFAALQVLRRNAANNWFEAFDPIDDITPSSDKTYSSNKTQELHNAQAVAIANLAWASCSFYNNTSVVIPESPVAPVDLTWTTSSPSSNENIFVLWTNEISFKKDWKYNFFNIITFYRLSDWSVADVTFELYDADTSTIIGTFVQHIDMTAWTKISVPMNALITISWATALDPVRMKVRMQSTAVNWTIEMFSFNSILAAQSTVAAWSTAEWWLITWTLSNQVDLQNALNAKQNTSEKWAANWYVPLWADTKISSTYLPSYVDDAIEVTDYASLPVTWETWKIYIVLTWAEANREYRWSGSVYVEIKDSWETARSLWALYNWSTAKTTLVDTDMLWLMDSEALNIFKKISWADTKATLKTYFDTLYNNYSLPTSSTTVLWWVKVDWTTITIDANWVISSSWWAWLTWWASITWTSWTWLLTTIWNSASAGTIGQSIVANDTQTNELKLLNISYWTSNWNHKWISINSTEVWWRQIDLQIREYTTATQNVAGCYWISIWNNWNTNSWFLSRKIMIENEQNTWTWANTWLYINSYSTDSSAVAWDWNAITVYHSWTGWTVFNIYADNNTNSSTNGLINYTLSNTQSWATVMQKIDLGTSAQGHTGLNIIMANASATARGINISPWTTTTWSWISFTTQWATWFKSINWENTMNSTNSTIKYWIYQDVLWNNTWVTTYWIYQNKLSNIWWTASWAYLYWFYQEQLSSGWNCYWWKVNNLIQVSYTWALNDTKYFSLNNAQSANLTSGSMILDPSEILHSRVNTATSLTVADNFNLLNLKRTSIQNWTWWTFTATWSVLKLENVATQTAWTLTDTVSVLTLTQWVATTWSLITMVSWNTNSRAIDFATNLTTATAPLWAVSYINVKINWVAHRILAQAV